MTAILDLCRRAWWTVAFNCFAIGEIIRINLPERKKWK